MANTVQLLKDGQPVYPITDVSLVIGLEDAIKLPPVKVTTLPTASAETAGKMYYVGPDANDEYERYITSATGGSYSWIDLGDTSIPLPSIADNLTTNDANTALSAKQGVVLEGEISQLGQEVTGVKSIRENAFIGGWSIGATSYTPASNSQRVGIEEFQLNAGDKITLSDYTKCRMYIGYRDANGNGSSGAWVSADYTAPVTGIYVITLEGIPAATVSDISDLTKYLVVKRSISQILINERDLRNLREEEIQSKTMTATDAIGPLAQGFVYILNITAASVSNKYVYIQGTGNVMQGRLGPIAVNKYYIPILPDAGTNIYIRMVLASGESLSYTLTRVPFVDFVDANGLPQFKYVRALSNTLVFQWVQGYYTSYKDINNASYWCNTNFQFNRGRRVKITIASGFYAMWRHLSYDTLTPYDGSQITSGTTYNTTNYGPWLIAVRRSDYSSITPADAASAVTIEQVDGDVYEMEMGKDAIESILSKNYDFSARIANLESQTQINPRLGTLELGKLMHHLSLEAANPIIPSQSLYDIAFAKNLGFKMIEANLHACSDGVVVVKHGSGGKLGAGLLFAEGSGLSADTLFSEVSSTDLRQYVTYNARSAKYRGHIPTLDEFCAECASLGIVPFLRGCTTEMLAIARKHLPDDRIIVEGPSNRGDFRGIMTLYGGSDSTPEVLLSLCKHYGQPFYYAWSGANNATNEDFDTLVQTLHSNGFMLGAAYLTENRYQDLKSRGLDISVSTNRTIPEFNVGNALNVYLLNDEKIVLTDATYNSTDRTIEMQNGGTLTINDANIGSAETIAKVCIRIRYNGTIEIKPGLWNDTSGNITDYASDGTREIVYSYVMDSAQGGLALFRLYAKAATTIYDIKVAASIIGM